MFTEFKPIKGSLWQQQVNSLLGIAFLGTCALWAAMFIWDLTDTANPVERAIATTLAAPSLGE